MIVTKCIDRDIYNYNHGYSIWTGKDRTGGPNLRRGLETSSKRSLQRREKKGKERRKEVNNTRLAVDFFVTLPECGSEGTARLLP